MHVCTIAMVPVPAPYVMHHIVCTVCFIPFVY